MLYNACSLVQVSCLGSTTYIHIYTYTCIHVYIYMVTPPWWSMPAFLPTVLPPVSVSACCFSSIEIVHVNVTSHYLFYWFVWCENHLNTKTDSVCRSVLRAYRLLHTPTEEDTRKLLCFWTTSVLWIRKERALRALGNLRITKRHEKKLSPLSVATNERDPELCQWLSFSYPCKEPQGTCVSVYVAPKGKG